MRSPGLGSAMPMASYSGSYQPAPMPTSSRPSQMRSRVASDFARIAAGRSASQSTRVPSRGPRDDTRQRGERNDRIEHAATCGGTAVLGEVEEQMVRHPEGVVPGAFGGPRILHDAGPPQRRLPRDRVVVLRECQSDAHRRHSTGIGPGRRRTLHGCSSACRTCPRDVTSASSTRSHTRAEPRCSTATSTPITTDRCSPWPGNETVERRARALARRWPNTSISGATPARTRGSVRSTSCPSSRSTANRRAPPSTPRATSRRGLPRRSWSRCSSTTPPTRRRGRCPRRGVTRSPAVAPTSDLRRRTPGSVRWRWVPARRSSR